MRLVCHTDGSAHPTPGPTRIGVLIEDSEGDPLVAISEATGIGTSNTAEYKAILRALEQCKIMGGTKVTLYTDSQLCERQLNGEFKSSLKCILKNNLFHKMNRTNRKPKAY